MIKDRRFLKEKTQEVVPLSAVARSSDVVNVDGLPGELSDPQPSLLHDIITGHTGFPGGTSDFLRADGAFAPPPAIPPPAAPLSHGASHEDGGVDEINVGGLSGLLADPQTPLGHVSSHENGGADELNVGGLSGLLADPQTPVLTGLGGRGLVLSGSTLHFAQDADYTPGAIPFPTSTTAIGFDAANLFWDDTANRLEVRNLTVNNIPTFNLPNTFSGKGIFNANNLFAEIDFKVGASVTARINWDVSIFTLLADTPSAFGSTVGLVTIYSGPTQSWNYNLGILLPGTDNIFDIGSVTKRVRSLYLGTSLFTPALTVSGLTAGSVLFAGAGGLLSQDNANLFWDDALNKLKVSGLELNGSFQFNVPITLAGIIDAPGNSRIDFKNSGGTAGFVFWDTGLFRIRGSTELSLNGANSLTFRVGITEYWRMDSFGHFFATTDNSIDIGAIGANRPRTLYLGTSLFTPALTVSGLTAGSIPFAGAGGLLSQDNANLFWDDGNDRLGLGTASPGARLDARVEDAGVGTKTLISIFGRTGAAPSATERAAGFVFTDADNGTFTAGVGGVRQNSLADYNGALAFYVSNGGALPVSTLAGLTEAMRINNYGNVGIGMVPGSINKLQVVGTTSLDGGAGALALHISSGNAIRNTGATSADIIYMDSPGWLFRDPSNSYSGVLELVGSGLAASGGGYAVSLASARTVGRFGTYNSVSMFHTFYDDVTLELSAGSTAGAVSGISMTGNYLDALAGTVRIMTASTERLRVDSAGRVGIGAAPLANTILDVTAGANAVNQQLFLRNSGTYHTGLIASSTITPLADNSAWGLFGGPGSYLTGTAEAVALMGGLNVPSMAFRFTSTNLNVAGGFDAFKVLRTGAFTHNGPTGASGIFNCVVSSDSRLEFHMQNVRSGGLGWDTAQIQLFSDGELLLNAATQLVLYSNSVSRWYLPSAGHLLATTDNTIDIGDATHRPSNVYAASKVITPQIQFPSTEVPSSDPNNFDGYKEAQWTPIDSSGAGLSFTVVAADCNYRKYASMIVANFRLVYPATANAAGAVIGGLPFTSINSDGMGGFPTYQSSLLNMMFAMAANGTYFAIFKNDGNQFANSALSGMDIRGTIIYFCT